jgi:signal transduction histidine kinase
MKGVLNFDETKENLYDMVQSLVSEIKGQRDLLAAESNELSVVPTPLNSRIFLDSVVHGYRNSFHGRERRILIDPESDETIFYSDERLLGRVVGNLIKNALEASPEGGLVTLGCKMEGDEITFWCNNCGEIPPETQIQIFHRSFSTKDAGRGTGTYSVKLLTERYLKGRVAFSSTSTEGTTFSVTYPLELKN